MKTPLDIIEIRLKTIIESSAQLLPESLRKQSLAERLIASMRASLREDHTGQIVAAHIYSIYVHPDSLARWTEKSEVFTILSQELADSAIEAGIMFTQPPAIRLLPDGNLFLEEIRIDAGFAAENVEQTSAIPVSTASLRGRETPDPRPLNAFLIVENDIFPLRDAVINIGRRVDNHIIISDPRVSRSHAQLRAVHGRYVIFDLNSTGGTSVNNQRIDQHTLKPGDVISLSGVPLIYGEDHDTSVDDTGELPGLINSTSNQQD
jgi:hypothetical protein